jgi:hypothetical protein
MKIYQDQENNVIKILNEQENNLETYQQELSTIFII